MHELAHMWFGNMVTMKWWDDVWLNESFATYLSFKALDESPKLGYLGNPWVTFLQYPFWGVSSDSLSSTHAIMQEVHRTDLADALFDGICYGKGSAWLKQLQYFVGEEVFRAGIQLYISKNKWGNTVFTDFIGAIIECYKGDIDLNKWCSQWVQ